MRVQKKSVEQKSFMHNFPIKFLIIARRIADDGECNATTNSQSCDSHGLLFLVPPECEWSDEKNSEHIDFL